MIMNAFNVQSDGMILEKFMWRSNQVGWVPFNKITRTAEFLMIVILCR